MHMHIEGQSLEGLQQNIICNLSFGDRLKSVLIFFLCCMYFPIFLQWKEITFIII